MQRILIVDDERGVRDSLQAILSDDGFEVDSVATGEECLARLESEQYEVVLLDIWLPRMDGLEVLGAIGSGSSSPSVIIISGHGSIESAVRATKLGAFDFIEKPLSLDKTLLVVHNALRQRRLMVQNRMLRRQVVGKPEFVGDSEAVQKLRHEIAAAAAGSEPVLLEGENGAGKELAARAIHAMSQRADEPFVELHCAGTPEQLVETELFGVHAGSAESRRGRLELADGGSLLLHEVGELPLHTQEKLLQLLRENSFQPMGAPAAQPSDVRLLAATTQDLDAAVEREAFRADLLERLRSRSVRMPALRDRRVDIAPLVGHFADRFRRENGRGPERFSDEALEALAANSWPGNVGELFNVVERMMLTVAKETVERRDLPAAYRDAGSLEDPFASSRTLREGREIFERQFIQRRLAENNNNITRTAQALGLERSHLHRKIKALGLNGG
jgi:two-component system nitrogen regulation response regulator NtrX